jgi:uncharacterized membrane protein YphA (DoxX/SURF4 family)
VAGYGLTCLRVTVGAIYLVQAYLALFVSTPRGIAAFIAKTAEPPMPTLVALGVIVILGVGGGLLVLGLWSRLAASANALLLVAFAGALWLRQGVIVRGPVLDVATSRQLPAGYEYILLLLAATVALALSGPGAASAGKGKGVSASRTTDSAVDRERD